MGKAKEQIVRMSGRNEHFAKVQGLVKKHLCGAYYVFHVKKVQDNQIAKVTASVSLGVAMSGR